MLLHCDKSHDLRVPKRIGLLYTLKGREMIEEHGENETKQRRKCVLSLCLWETVLVHTENTDLLLYI